MTTTALVAEFLLIGIVPFATIIFSILAVYQVKDFSYILQAKDFSSAMVIAATFLIYLIGAITHRLTQLVNKQSISFLRYIPILQKIVPDYSPEHQMNWFKAYFTIFQRGSEHLVKIIEYHESQIRVFKSLTISLPILMVPLSIWLYQISGSQAVILANIIGLLLTLASFAAFRLQRQNYRSVVRMGAENIQSSEEINSLEF